MEDSILVFPDRFEYKSEDGNYYVEGILEMADYIDSVNDVVTNECINDMKNQILGKEMKAVFKGNLDHEHVTEDMRLVPRAKIIDAEVKGKALFIKAMLNKHHPEFKSVWGSIENGFLDAFSMEFRPIEYMNQQYGGRTVRVLNKVELGGVALTGRPINEACKITDFFVKSKAIEETKSEVEKMEEEKVEAKSEAVDISKELMEMKSQIAELREMLEAKAEEVPAEPEPVEEPEKTEVKSFTETEIKSMIAEAIEASKPQAPVVEQEANPLEVKSEKPMTVADYAARAVFGKLE